MTRIGLLSDTHAYWDEKYLEYFESCDEIWHAGDIGSVEVAEKLAAFRPLRAVYGNIDGQEIRKMFPQVNRFTVDGAEVLIKHIGGYPGKYDPSVIGSLMARPPKLFISGPIKKKFRVLPVLKAKPGILLAEKEGFEPSIPFWGIHDFQSCALGQLRDFSITVLSVQPGYNTTGNPICQA